MAISDPTSPLDAEALRAREFPLLGDTPYLNAASVTPLPERSRRAIDEYNRRRGAVQRLGDDDFAPVLDRCRRGAAGLIGAEPDEIALIGNTSYGINVAARNLPLEPGSCVVASDREFPANVYPWMRLPDGVRLELVPADELGRPDPARLYERLDRGDVSVFALSAVQFATGYHADLASFGRFCREREIFFVVDAIQALGHVPVDVRAAGIDLLASGGHKWLLGPFGTGFIYIRRELLAQIEPTTVGWTAMEASADYARLLDYRWEPVADARRFEVGTHPLQDYAGLGESLELLREVGPQRIHAHVVELLEPLAEWLLARSDVVVVSDLRPEHRSGIFAFRPPSPERSYDALRQAGVICSLREGAIRLAPHLYNTVADIDRVVEVLRRELR